MTSNSRAPSQERRLIFKVLILGEDPALQAGFLSQASGESVSYQLYPTLGVGLGVASVHLTDTCSAILQLWSIPSIERYRGVTSSFVKGHRALIVVIRPEEIESISALVERIDTQYRDTLIVVIVGERHAFKLAIERFPEIKGMYIDSMSNTSILDVLTTLSSHLAHDGKSSSKLPLIARIDPELCPPVQPQAFSYTTPPSSEKDVEMIKRITHEMGLTTDSSRCIIDLHEGTVEIDLYIGSVKFHPRLCNHCRRGCKRTVSICIVDSDEGWSSDGLERRSLLTLAKIYGLSKRDLPSHVERQLLHATQCSSFEWMLQETSKEDDSGFGYVPRKRRRTLLEVARNRVNEGRLSESIYNLLEQRFSSASSRDE